MNKIVFDSVTGGWLTGKTILIVGPNATAGVELAALIEGKNARPIGPLTSAAAGLAMLKTIVIDAAVVDCDVPSYETLAIGLYARNIPCVWQLILNHPAKNPFSHTDAALTKPVSASGVLSALETRIR